MSRSQEECILATVVRAVRVLDALKEAGELTFTELVDALGIDKSTVYRFLITLKHLRLVDQDPKSSKYRLGIGILEYANR